MNDIEICNITEEISPEDILKNFAKSRKSASKKKVTFPELEVQSDGAHSARSMLYRINLNIIKDNIPENYRTIVYQLYFLCILHNIINLGNFLYAILAVQNTISLASTVVYSVISVVYSYLVWIQCAHQTFTHKSKSYVTVFLVTFFLMVLFSCIQTMGIYTISIFISALEKSPDVKSYTNHKMITELIVVSACGCGALIDVTIIVMSFNIYPKIMNFCKITTPEDEIITPA